jgi:hypothetical protein
MKYKHQIAINYLTYLVLNKGKLNNNQAHVDMPPWTQTPTPNLPKTHKQPLLKLLCNGAHLMEVGSMPTLSHGKTW